MGQTLTHGVYLPDEGERSCYNGLAANWQILDTSVGTIAAHTAALAGKAPAVHTHTVSQITDFPAYGNAAGTICEGNDSRLSDARTPVAHTHTKSDVTDLLNSNFIPSANNSYDLGSSTYQWNNLYAKNYYYNGTAWGLDKVNTWSNYNSYSKGIELVGGRYAYILPEFAANYSGISILTNSFGKSVKFGNYTVDENSVVSLDTTLGFVEISAGNANSVNSSRIQPRNAAVAELGTSANKWTTLNGINPGALSLPKTDSSITGIETSGFSFDGTNERIPDTVNIFSNGVALMNGWLCARIAEGAGHYIFLSSDDNTGRYGICSSCFSSGIVTTLSFGVNVYVPIKAGDKPAIRWAKPNGGGAQLVFYPCLGNV